MHPRPDKILICVNRRFKSDEASCAQRGSLAIAEAFERGIQARQIDIAFDRFVCFGQCQKGPTVKLVPGDFILGASLDMVEGILDKLEAACGTKKDSDASDEPPAHLLGS